MVEEVRDGVEADAEALATIEDVPTDVIRNLVHDRTVRVAEVDGDPVGFVSFDARDGTVHVTQVGGSTDACERLLAEPVRFAAREGMAVELLVPVDDGTVRDAAERAGFEEDGEGPPFGGTRTVRYRLAP